jgi:hypothetical protein
MNETMDVASAGNFQYDTPGGLTMDLGKNNPKTKAETKHNGLVVRLLILTIVLK